MRRPRWSLLIPLVVAALGVARTADAQGVGGALPERPIPGDTLRLRYRAPDGKTPRHVDAILFLSAPGGGTTRGVTLQPVDGEFRGATVLPAQLSSGAVHFVADGSWDRAAARGFVAVDRDGALARGAHGAAMATAPVGERDALLAESRRLHPELVDVYRDRWIAARESGEPGLDTRIRRDLAVLATDSVSPADARLYTRLSGLLLLGDFADARRALGALVADHPESPFVGRALQRYRFERLSVGGADPGEGDTLDRWAAELARRFPRSTAAREHLVYLVRDSTWTLGAIDAIAEPWAESEPDNPIPHLYRAEARLRRGVHDGSSAAARRALELLLAGKLAHYGTLERAVAQDRIRDALDLWSRAVALDGDSTLALAIGAGASALRTAADRAEPALHAAALWQAAGQLRLAEQDYLRAVAAGAPPPSALRELHARTIDADASFERYLDEAGRHAGPSAAPRYLPAFDAVGLDGVRAGSGQLLGRVAVLNFWFTTCLPCLDEIPKLNALRAAWAGRDVAFVGYALDERATLTRFLRANPFRYRVVAQAGPVAERFGVEAFPLHLVLDRTGRVRLAVKGGQPETLDRIRATIRALLAEPAAGDDHGDRDAR